MNNRWLIYGFMYSMCLSKLRTRQLSWSLKLFNYMLYFVYRAFSIVCADAAMERPELRFVAKHGSWDLGHDFHGATN
jgi:hypothetical protein